MRFLKQDGATLLEVDDHVEELMFPRLAAGTMCPNLGAGLASLKSLRSLTLIVSSSGDAVELEALRGLRHLVELKIGSIPAGADLTPVATCAGLRVLRLVGVTDVDVSPLARLSLLNELFLSGSPRNLERLASFEGLLRLGVEASRRVSVRWFEKNRALARLSVAGSSARDFCTFPELIDLDVRGSNVSSIEDLGTQPNLEALALDRCKKLRSLEGLQRFENLRALSLGGLLHVDTLAPIGHLRRLTSLDLRGARVSAKEIRWLADLPELTFVDADSDLETALRLESKAYPRWRARIGVGQGAIETLGSVSIYSADEGGKTVYRIDQDLTGLLQVETNSEAEDLVREAIQELLLPAPIELDSEAARFVALSSSIEAVRLVAQKVGDVAARRASRAARSNKRKLRG